MDFNLKTPKYLYLPVFRLMWVTSWKKWDFSDTGWYKQRWVHTERPTLQVQTLKGRKLPKSLALVLLLFQEQYLFCYKVWLEVLQGILQLQGNQWQPESPRDHKVVWLLPSTAQRCISNTWSLMRHLEIHFLFGWCSFSQKKNNSLLIFNVSSFICNFVLFLISVLWVRSLRLFCLSIFSQNFAFCLNFFLILCFIVFMSFNLEITRVL